MSQTEHGGNPLIAFPERGRQEQHDPDKTEEALAVFALGAFLRCLRDILWRKSASCKCFEDLVATAVLKHSYSQGLDVILDNVRHSHCRSENRMQLCHHDMEIGYQNWSNIIEELLRETGPCLHGRLVSEEVSSFCTRHGVQCFGLTIILPVLSYLPQGLFVLWNQFQEAYSEWIQEADWQEAGKREQKRQDDAKEHASTLTNWTSPFSAEPLDFRQWRSPTSYDGNLPENPSSFTHQLRTPTFVELGKRLSELISQASTGGIITKEMAMLANRGGPLFLLQAVAGFLLPHHRYLRPPSRFTHQTIQYIMSEKGIGYLWYHHWSAVQHMVD